MSLMSLIRWIGVVAIGWTIVALGIGASGTRLPDDSRGERAVLPAAGTPSIAAMPANWPYPERFEIVDLESGRTSPLRLPTDDRWSSIAISPWMGPDGEPEAVGRWINPEKDDFGGWGVFRLSDGAVQVRVATEVLPTGRPCWVPGRSRMIVFAAGDGQLHRCPLDHSVIETEPQGGPVYASGRLEPSSLITWTVPIPGSGEVMFSDPIWSADPRLSRWVFASMMTLKEDRRGRPAYGPAELWWLELGEDARVITAAGRLTDPSQSDSQDVWIDRRLPSVAAGPDGTVRMAYLERRDRRGEWRLRTGVLAFDVRTGRPRTLSPSPDCEPPPELNPALQSAPVVLLADGATVYGINPMGRLGAITPGLEPSRHLPRESAGN